MIARARAYTGAMPRALLLCALLAFAACSAVAQPSAAEAQAIRAVVSSQIEAFGRDDGEAAFALATDAIRERFGTPQEFLRMVRTGYPVVYRPRSLRFEPPVAIDGGIVQPVRMTDTEGRAWLALYTMQRRPDGAWRIDGCALSRLAAQET